MKKRLTLCVTNDLHYDQRVTRIGQTLQELGYHVKLIGRRYPDRSRPQTMFRYHRFRCWFHQGFAFYLEFNLRLFAHLLVARNHVVVANDADTLLGVGMASWFKRFTMVYDSHEWFTEVPELKGKPLKRKVWHYLQKIFVPRAVLSITVGPKLAVRLSNMYHTQFHSIRNVPQRRNCDSSLSSVADKVLIYQGALNEGRGVELAIQAIKDLPGWKLWIAGVGPMRQFLGEEVEKHGVQDRVTFYEGVTPQVLHDLTGQATIGLNMLEKKSMNYYFSLANKFFDYIQAGIPIITMDFPEYREHNKICQTSILLPEYTAESLVEAVQDMSKEDNYRSYQSEVQKASKLWTWEKESVILKKLFDIHVVQNK